MSEPICPKCNRRMPVRTSNRIGETQVRYHECKCGEKATRAVPVAAVLWRKKLD